MHLEDDVGIKVGLEVSNISNEVKTASGTVAYQVGTRNANTTLRLRDGETQVLAGLISDEDRRSAQKVPGVAQLPVLGRLFSSNNDTVNKTEIVLLITPRVIRNIERPGVRLEEFNSGTEMDVGRGAGGAAPAGERPARAPCHARNPQPRNRRPRKRRVRRQRASSEARCARAAAAMKARGFTLVELLIVVAIVALLASIAAPLAELSYQRGKEQELRTALREIREAIDTYKRAADDGMIEKSADSSGYPPSLKTLVEGVPDKSTPEEHALLPAPHPARPDQRRGLGRAWLCQPGERPAAGQGCLRRLLEERRDRSQQGPVQGVVT